jgi:hypothetical protein
MRRLYAKHLRLLYNREKVHVESIATHATASRPEQEEQSISAESGLVQGIHLMTLVMQIVNWLSCVLHRHVAAQQL